MKIENNIATHPATVQFCIFTNERCFMQKTKVIKVPVEQDVEQAFNDLNLNIASAIQEFLRETVERNTAKKMQKNSPVSASLSI